MDERIVIARLMIHEENLLDSFRLATLMLFRSPLRVKTEMTFDLGELSLCSVQARTLLAIFWLEITNHGPELPIDRARNTINLF